MSDIGVLKFEHKEGDLPFHPFCNLILTSYAKDEDGHVILTPQLINPTEVDFWADYIIDQVNAARKVAKKHVTTARGTFHR
jgi:hypothetical protein